MKLLRVSRQGFLTTESRLVFRNQTHRAILPSNAEKGVIEKDVQNVQKNFAEEVKAQGMTEKLNK